MMWLVRFAISRPYFTSVMSAIVLVFGLWTAFRIPKDILPNIDTPIVSVVWSYAGIPASDFEKRITTLSEFSLSNTVNGIERIESQTLNGLALIRIYFHPGIDVKAAISQVSSSSQEILRQLPKAANPPVILFYSPSTIPIVQMMITSDTVPEQNLYDYTSFRLRHLIASINGLTLPPPFGGKILELMIDTYPEALQARGLSAADVQNAINKQNIIIPTGNAKIGNFDYCINSNNTLDTPEDYNNLPIAEKDGAIIYLRDVGFAHEGFPPQTNIVRNNGSRSVLLTILKNGNTSTIEIVKKLKQLLPSLQASAPKNIQLALFSDQSIHVKAAIQNVLRQGAIATLLIGLLSLFFLKNWINTLIVFISIPLSILASILALYFMGISLNLMTLGGLALATGFLIDNAIITIENIHRKVSLGKSFRQAVIEGSNEIALPSFFTTLAICAIFLPIGFLSGASKILILPLAYSAMIAIASSYLLSRTLIPVMILFLNKEHHIKNFSFFTHLQEKYEKALTWSLENREVVLSVFCLLIGSSFILMPFIGIDFFPSTTSSEIRLHVTVPAGTRIEMTEEAFGDIEEEIRKILPQEDVLSICDNIGINPIPHSLAFGDNTSVGTWDGEIVIALDPSKERKTPHYKNLLRKKLKEHFSDYQFFFQPADMISRILSFGLPAPIDIKIVGYDEKNNLHIARKLADKISQIPGATDIHIHQEVEVPELFVNVNRQLLSKINLTQDIVADNLLITNSNSAAITPNFWINKDKGLPYPIAVQTPKYRVDSIEALMRTPISYLDSANYSTQIQMPPLKNVSYLERTSSELLSNIASIQRQNTSGVINHFNIQPVYDVFVDVEGKDLGTIYSKIHKIIDELKPELTPGNELYITGTASVMSYSYHKLALGLIASLLLIYFILVISFESWSQPLIIIFSLPCAISGILWALYLTRTSINISSLMGAVVVIGLSIAHAALIIAFTKQELLTEKQVMKSLFNAGKLRLRPILMTILPTIVAMIPLALGIGTEANQQAPLARVIIGGLIVSTFSSLFLVPVIFSYLSKKSQALESK